MRIMRPDYEWDYSVRNNGQDKDQYNQMAPLHAPKPPTDTQPS